MKVDRLGSGMRVRASQFSKKNAILVGRLGSGVEVSAGFQIFALTDGEK